jgi:hypothetical protein
MTKARDLANASTALSAVSATELAFLDGVTSAVQTQVDAKIAKTLTTTTGDIIYASGANTPARLGIGSSAQVLAVSGGVPAWTTPSSGALTLISTQTFSAVSSLNVNSCFSATYKNYQIMMNITSASTLDYIHLKLRASSTDSSTAYYGWLQRNFSSSATQPTQTSNTVNGTSGFEIAGGFKVLNAICDVMNPFTAIQTSFFGLSTHWDAGNTRTIAGTTQGMHDAATSYDGFSIVPASGTMTGTVNIYGYGV